MLKAIVKVGSATISREFPVTQQGKAMEWASMKLRRNAGHFASISQDDFVIWTLGQEKK